ncbi:MAG: Holliday junction resolvase RuvX [Pseudomonadales bacterium]
MSNINGTVLAFDFGLKHIGVAVGQTITQTANPLTTLEARNGTPRWADIEHLSAEWRPVCLLVGLPLNMDDSESVMSGHARNFARKLQARLGLAVEMVDERLTSHAARDSDQPHATAAALIAETWLSDRVKHR